MHLVILTKKSVLIAQDKACLGTVISRLKHIKIGHILQIKGIKKN